MLFLQQKCLPCFFYLALALFLVEFCWPVAYFLFFSVFIFLYFQFPLSVFVFIDSLVVSALQDAGGYAISYQNNLELHLGCHTCLLIYFTLACLWCGRTGGRTVTWLPNFLGWEDYHIFLGMGLRSRMVTLYNKSENSWFFLLKKWELLWQLNLNITFQHFALLQNFIYQVFFSKLD